MDNVSLVNGTTAIALERTTVGGSTAVPKWTTISNMMCDQFETACIVMEQDSAMTLIDNLHVEGMGGSATGAVVAEAGCGGAGQFCFHLDNSDIRGIGTKGVVVAAGVSDFTIQGTYFNAGAGETAIEIAAGASDSYIISNNLFDGAGTYITDGGTGAYKTILGNMPSVTATVIAPIINLGGSGAGVAGHIEIGASSTGDRNSYIDFHSDDTYSDYGARFIKNSGANGAALFDVRGTGGISFRTVEAGPVIFSTTNVVRIQVPSDGGLDIIDSGAQPTCNATHRGVIWMDEGGAGVADSLTICAKDAGDAYAWRTIY